MAISLLGKIVITIVTLAVIAGMTVVIVFLVNDGNDEVEKTTPAPTTPPPVFEDTLYDVGIGIADMTGPAVEIVFMGYAEIGQTGRGLHMRQFSRAFIFVQGDKRVVLVTTETLAVGVHVRRQVVRNLQEIYGEDTYTLRNVIITGTHTHSGPGGHLVNFVLDVSARGFSRGTFNAYVDGITRSIVRAHDNIIPARLFYGQTTVPYAQKNRSPFSYVHNPPEELARYDGDVDNQLTQIRIVKQNGDLYGVLNWFALHTTSMNMTNRLISSDNLGYAAIKMEKTLNPNSLTGKPEIVAGFFTANLGDVSPNLEEARCEFSGDICDHQFTLCERGERCFAGGPGEDMFESTKIIGTRVYEGAMEVLSTPGEELTGDIAVVHQFIDMPNAVVAKYNPVTRTFNANCHPTTETDLFSTSQNPNIDSALDWRNDLAKKLLMNEPVNNDQDRQSSESSREMNITDENDMVSGCLSAMGYSFASGTTDGANTLNITQGTLEGDEFWDLVAGLVAPSTPEDDACHHPKPILLATGRNTIPTPWHPQVISASLIMLGGLAVVGVPGEPTTMAGRRMRDVVGQVMEEHGIEPRVVVSGLTNEYIHYLATFEEYQVQRYEAASTIFGPHTLDIFLNKFSEFAAAAIEGVEVPEGPEPGDHINSTLSFILPVIADNSGLLQSFGNVLEQPPSRVRRGDTVSVTFVGSNPRNDLRQESTFSTVERQDLGQWRVIATDADWETRLIWERTSTILGTSTVTIAWEVPLDAIQAPHRITYYGASRSILGSISQFSGQSNVFLVDDSVVR